MTMPATLDKPPTNSQPTCCAKVVATLGPASSTPEVVEAMISAGLSVARLNMSHGEHADHQARLTLVRDAAEKLNVPVGVLADLQGPKIRTGILENREPVELVSGSTVTFALSDEPGNAQRITTTMAPIFEALEVGTVILINDGALRLEVTEVVSDTEVTCTVIHGGELNERKGINLPGHKLNIDALTDKDREDALFAVRAGVDFLALSFVQSADDIRLLKTHLRNHDLPVPPIVAKIEKPQALEDMDAIFEEADTIMVARGDLGVELPPERVPVAQKQLVEKGLEVGKPVIVATQMLDSMTYNSTPSRAEVSDVANAVLDGADALMLSGETAMGQYPVETIAMMRRVIAEAEQYVLATNQRHRFHEASTVKSPHYHHAIAHAASYLSRKADIQAVVVLSQSGTMARRISKLRPQHTLLALTESAQVYRQMALLWGVQPMQVRYLETTDATLHEAESQMIQEGLLKMGDGVLFCSGLTPIEGATNMLKLFTIGDPVQSASHLLGPMV